MSQMAPERPPAARGGAGGTGLKKKAGPLPVWAWVVLGTVAAGIGWYWWKNRQASQQQQAADQTGAGTNADGTQATTILPEDQGLTQSQYDALQAQISDLQGEESKVAQEEASEPPDTDGGQPPSHICPPGYFWEPSSGRCQKNPIHDPGPPGGHGGGGPPPPPPPRRRRRKPPPVRGHGGGGPGPPPRRRVPAGRGGGGA